MTIQETDIPQLWSDFDGTAVEAASKTTLRGWLNYPLAGIEGYSDFLLGVRRGGVTIAGVLSRRLNTPLNRRMTARTIAGLRLADFFGSDQVILVNTEDQKARHIVEQSRVAPVSIIDDRPHRIGRSIIRHLESDTSESRPRHIVIGAVRHERTQECMDRLAVAGADYGIDVRETSQGYVLSHPAASIAVVALGAYSEGSGQDYARYLLQAARS